MTAIIEERIEALEKRMEFADEAIERNANNQFKIDLGIIDTTHELVELVRNLQNRVDELTK